MKNILQIQIRQFTLTLPNLLHLISSETPQQSQRITKTRPADFMIKKLRIRRLKPHRRTNRIKHHIQQIQDFRIFLLLPQTTLQTHQHTGDVHKAVHFPENRSCPVRFAQAEQKGFEDVGF